VTGGPDDSLRRGMQFSRRRSSQRNTPGKIHSGYDGEISFAYPVRTVSPGQILIFKSGLF
jgi:hypothetical protein